MNLLRFIFWTRNWRISRWFFREESPKAGRVRLMATRKILLPDYCVEGTGQSSGGDPSCNHDYPPDSKSETAEFVTWKCSKCGMWRSYEVSQ